MGNCCFPEPRGRPDHHPPKQGVAQHQAGKKAAPGPFDHMQARDREALQKAVKEDPEMMKGPFDATRVKRID